MSNNEFYQTLSSSHFFFLIADIKGCNRCHKDLVESFKFFTKPLMLLFPILAVFKIGITQVDAVKIRHERQMNYTTKCFA